MMTLMTFYNLCLLVVGHCDVICSNAAAPRYGTPCTALRSFNHPVCSCCVCRAVCVVTGFHPYGTAQTWTKLNRTGCQEQEQVRQQGEHVKRPDAFLSGDSYWVRQLVPARSEQMWNEIILHKGISGEIGWTLQGQTREWKVSVLKCLLRKCDKPPVLGASRVAQGHKGCSRQVTATRWDVNTKLRK